MPRSSVRPPAAGVHSTQERERAGCAQAYNAEKAGAKAIVVMDYRDERLLTMAAPEDRPEIAKLRDDITIPPRWCSRRAPRPLPWASRCPAAGACSGAGALGAVAHAGRAWLEGMHGACERMARAVGLMSRQLGDVRARAHPPNTTARAACARA